jgi:hypothetical protein
LYGKVIKKRKRKETTKRDTDSQEDEISDEMDMQLCMNKTSKSCLYSHAFLVYTCSAKSNHMKFMSMYKRIHCLY